MSSANQNGKGIEFSQQYLFASDFDNTAALTSEPAPNGMTVELAYMVAVGKVLDPDSQERYRCGGGLRNRAPSEVVAELAPYLDADSIREKTNDLIEVKLSLLTDQIGERLDDGARWPRPTNGFSDFWQGVSDKSTIDTAILSSGHEDFIRRFYEVQELPQPDLMVTNDDMEPLMAHLPRELCVKPGRLLLDLLHARWLLSRGQTIENERLLTSRGRILYAGDDPEKDGQLAANTEVAFVHIPPADSLEAWKYASRILIPKHQKAIHAQQ